MTLAPNHLVSAIVWGTVWPPGIPPHRWDLFIHTVFFDLTLYIFDNAVRSVQQSLERK